MQSRKWMVNISVGTNVCISITRKTSDIVKLKINTSKEFLVGVESILRTGIQAFQQISTQKIRVSFKVNSGMCKVRCNIMKGTVLKTSFPVNDCESYGSITLTVDELNQLWDEIKRR